MSARAWIVGVMLAIAVLVNVLSAVGVLAMRDPFQKLHFTAPPATLSSVLVSAAVFLDEPQWVAGAKSVLVVLALMLANGVVIHATARAIRVRDHGSWMPRGEEHIPVLERGRPVAEASGGDRNPVPSIEPGKS